MEIRTVLDLFFFFALCFSFRYFITLPLTLPAFLFSNAASVFIRKHFYDGDVTYVQYIHVRRFFYVWYFNNSKRVAHSALSLSNPTRDTFPTVKICKEWCRNYLLIGRNPILVVLRFDDRHFSDLKNVRRCFFKKP